MMAENDAYKCDNDIFQNAIVSTYLFAFFMSKTVNTVSKNMRAVIPESAVLSINSEVESRGNFSNWLPTHS